MDVLVGKGQAGQGVILPQGGREGLLHLLQAALQSPLGQPRQKIIADIMCQRVDGMIRPVNRAAPSRSNTGLVIWRARPYPSTLP